MARENCHLVPRRRNALKSAWLPSSEIPMQSAGMSGLPRWKAIKLRKMRAASRGNAIGDYLNAAEVQSIPRAPRRPLPHWGVPFSGMDVVSASANGPRTSYIHHCRGSRERAGLLGANSDDRSSAAFRSSKDQA
jgi:hypothetical protein